MADVLSQSEIDALLSALSTGELQPEEIQGEEEKHKVKPYDFRSPQKFSKEHIRTLELIHDNFARVLSNYLTGQTRKNTKVKIENVEQMTYEEFLHSVPNPTVLTFFKMPPLTGSIIFEFNPQFSFQVIDILLGGSGDRRYLSKEFSDIDKNIIKQVATDIISSLKLAWDDVVEVFPEIESLETNPALNQSLAPTEPIALVTFSVEMGKNTSFINLCIPYLSIEKVIEKLVVQYWFQSEDDEIIETSRKKVRRRLDVVDVNLSVELGCTKIIMDDFLKLNVGDVIKLDNKSSEPVRVYVEDEQCYYAKPGLIGKNRGAAVLDIIEEDVENYD